MISTSSIKSFLDNIQVKNVETDGVALDNGAFAVKCSELCHATIHGVPLSDVPPSSDIGCRSSSSGKVCDVDLSPSGVAKIKFPSHKIVDKVLKTGSQSSSGSSTGNLDTLDDERHYPVMGKAAVRQAIARLFRVHLPTTILVHLQDKADKEVEAIEIAGLRAQAVVSTALNAMAAKSFPELVKKWFGNNEESTRKRLRYLLTGALNRVLSNVEYRYPGPGCDATTYAYIDPDEPPCDNANECARDDGAAKPYPFIVQLCDLYFEGTEGEKIKTIVHESLHHQPMNTDDVPGGYGLEGAKKLAERGPKTALNNADNLCFFVADVSVASRDGDGDSDNDNDDSSD
jgi:hypothetical protein